LTTSVLQLESRWFSLPCDMLNVENGKASSGRRTRHINIRYFLSRIGSHRARLRWSTVLPK
jgi:hypothetical protein